MPARREFEAGRSNPVMPAPSMFLPLGPDSPAPGRQDESIDEVLEVSDADGTRSIRRLFAGLLHAAQDWRRLA